MGEEAAAAAPRGHSHPAQMHQLSFFGTGSLALTAPPCPAETLSGRLLNLSECFLSTGSLVKQSKIFDPEGPARVWAEHAKALGPWETIGFHVYKTGIMLYDWVYCEDKTKMFVKCLTRCLAHRWCL